MGRSELELRRGELGEPMRPPGEQVQMLELERELGKSWVRRVGRDATPKWG